MPVDAAVPVPDAVADLSSVVDASPTATMTVRAIAELDADVPPAVTVTDWAVDRLAAFATYQISSTACRWETLAARTQTFDAESVTLRMGAGEVTLRSLTVATSRLPAVVAVDGDADSVALPVPVAAPKDCTNPELALADFICSTGKVAATAPANASVGSTANRIEPRRRRRRLPLTLSPFTRGAAGDP